jgi:hypothetical protein
MEKKKLVNLRYIINHRFIRELKNKNNKI